MRLLRKYLALDARDRLLYLEAWLHLGMARLALLVVPFRLIARQFGRESSGRSLPLDAPSPSLAKRVGVAIETMGRHTPWDSTCLTQTIAAGFMLRRRRLPSRLYLGTRRDDSGRLVAHSWLQSGDSILVGGSGHAGFAVLSAFDSAD